MNRLLTPIFLFVLGGSLANPRASASFPSEVRLRQILAENQDVSETSETLNLQFHWTVPQKIAMEGYPCETHMVITEDCYIMDMHRIPFGKHSPPQPGVHRPAVYLQHSLLWGSSAVWVLGTAETSLGFILADAGFDVWLGNFRGNTYGRKHCTLSPDEDEFWDFSWEDKVKYDIPAMIDKILFTTGHTQIHYVGHSTSNTGVMVTMNEKPEYADKIIMANEPVGSIKHITDSISLLAPYVEQIRGPLDNVVSDTSKMTETLPLLDHWTVPEKIIREGYPCEVHLVVTQDCYMLEMHRIPFGKHSPPMPGVHRPAVYLQHGLLGSSAVWVMGTPENSLGFILADSGFDVWLGNFRGNRYGHQQCKLDPSKDEFWDFWDFSWDEMGKYDIPAMIDKILYTTSHEKIHYIGHSMGNTAFMVTMNERPEYADKIIMANMLAPVAYVEHMNSPLHLLAPYVEEIEWIIDNYGIGRFLPIKTIMDLVCDTNGSVTCKAGILFLWFCFDPSQLDDTVLETIIYNAPDEISTRTILHYAQEFNSGGFHKYDFFENNNDHYGQDEPPNYSLEMVNVPVSMYWAQNDCFADVLDTLSLFTKLPIIFDNFEVPYSRWSHLDFLWHVDARALVYSKVIANMMEADNTLVQ